MKKREQSKLRVLPLEAPKRTLRGPEPERLKINGVKNWEDGVAIALRKPKPTGGWPH
jgi:hypothetical protein